MKRFKSLLLGALFTLSLTPTLPLALAQEAASPVKPAVSAPVAPAAVPNVVTLQAVTPSDSQPTAPDEVSAKDFLGQVLDVIKKFGGLSTVLKIAAIITLLVASMKVSFLNNLLWSKLGAAKVWVAPLLGLVAGLLDLAGAGTVTLASIVAYMGSGAGAILLHELLDSIKKIPAAGSVWVTIIEFVQKRLGGPAPKQN